MATMWSRINTIILLLVLFALLAVIGMLATDARSGPLDPSGPPAPTYKSLELIPPSWMRLLDSTNGDAEGCNSSRLACVMNGEAVLDLETGLVWQRDRDLVSSFELLWPEALDFCRSANIGGRRGWRVPRIDELMTMQPIMSAPPFTGDAAMWIWAATTVPGSTSTAFAYHASDTVVQLSKSLPYPSVDVVCVRGPGEDVVP